MLQNSHRTEKIINSLPIEIQICLTVRFHRAFNQICISKVKQQDYFSVTMRILQHPHPLKCAQRDSNPRPTA